MKKVSLGKICIVLSAAVAVFFVWNVLWGRLVPFSGIFIGFKRVETGLVVVMFHDDRAEAESVASLVNENIPAVVATLGRQAPERFEIVLCKTNREFLRFTGSSARFTTIKGRIFVSPRGMADAGSGTIHLSTYLVHELAHAIASQNRSFLAMFRFPAWLDEGLATYASEQTGVDGYFDKAKVCSWILEGKTVPPSDYVQHSSRSSRIASLPEQDRYHFIYSEFAFFVQDLIEREGRRRFLDYLDEVNKGEDWEKTFIRIYSAKPDERFEDFYRDQCI